MGCPLEKIIYACMYNTYTMTSAKTMQSRTTVTELYESLYLIRQTGKDATCGITGKRGGEHKIPIGVMAEILDYREIDSEYEDDPYPYHIHFSITALKFHESYKKSAFDCSGIDKEDQSRELVIIEECFRYGGGVPVSMDGIIGQNEDFSGINYKMRESKMGDKYIVFADHESCVNFIENIAAKRVTAIFTMIGFILDRQVNMIGNTGWNIISDQALGTKQFGSFNR
jgi:hypothetical protein